MIDTTDLKGIPCDLSEASIPQIGRVIRTCWARPYFGALPYIDALCDMGDDGMYGLDNDVDIMIYFLSNAASWRGPVARSVKKELRRRLKERGAP